MSVDVQLEERVQRQGKALVTLSRLEPTPDEEPGPLLQRITQIVSDTLEVERASIWLYTYDRQAIYCADLFQRSRVQHSSGGLLQKAVYPAYFAALEEERTVAAHDVGNDQRVMEFLEGYLKPLGIGAMLDAPVRARGKLLGVLCCEHIGNARTWSWDEQHFVGSAGDLVALVLESSQLLNLQREQAGT